MKAKQKQEAKKTKASRGDAETRRTAKTKGASRTLTELPVADCIGTNANPRTFNAKDKEFRELLADVKINGVVMPVIARKAGLVKLGVRSVSLWEVLAGRRRLEAAKAAKLEAIPALVYKGLSDAHAHELTVKENIQRENLKPMEESRAVRLILADNGNDFKAAAAFFGRTERWVHLRAKLADLDKAWQNRIADPEHGCFVWTAAHMELIARFPAHVQKRLAETYAQDWNYNQDYALSVKRLDAWVNETALRKIASAPFDIEDATLIWNAPACSVCEKRSSCQGLLFFNTEAEAKTGKNDQCLDSICWSAKCTARAKAMLAAAEAKHGSVLLVAEQYTTSFEDGLIREAYGRVPDIRGTSAYEIARSKADKAKAQIAMIAIGPRIGKLIHVLRESRGQSSSGGKRTGEKTPTPLEERRATLENKRRAETCKLLRADLTNIGLDALKALHKTRIADVFSAIASAFGTHAAQTVAGAPAWAVYDRLVVAGNMASSEHIWPSLRAVLICRLTPPSYIATTKTPPKYTDEAKRVAEVCGLDYDAAYAKACAVYTEPKTWATLNADGTKKKREAKAKAKTTTKKATKRAKKNNGKAKRKKILPTFTKAQRAEAMTRPRIEMPDGPTLLLIKCGPDKCAVYAPWWIAPDGTTDRRLSSREYPDRSDVRDAIEDLREWAGAHVRVVIEPKTTPRSPASRLREAGRSGTEKGKAKS